MVIRLERVKGNFAQAYDRAEERIATAGQLMKQRRLDGICSDFCNINVWTPESFACINENIYGLLKEFNPLIPYRKEAVLANENNEDLCLTEHILLNGRIAKEVILEIAEEDEKKPISRKRVINLRQILFQKISTDSLGDHLGIAFLARGKSPANKYGLFLKNEAGIDYVRFFSPPIQSKDYARGLLFCNIIEDNDSSFIANYSDLHNPLSSVFRVYSDKSDLLDERVKDSLERGLAFEYKGRLYVPTSAGNVSLEQKPREFWDITRVSTNNT